MPDGIDLKRIIDLDPETTVTDDDYTIVDSTTGGAKKFALGQALGEIKDGLSTVENNILTANIRQALLQIAEKVAYIDEDGQDYYDALYDALYPPVDLVSISAVYTQSGTVYDTDTLDSLKTDLVVTAHMSDSTTQTVTTYTLSGTLTVGTSTITVTYSGKTTTFNVTVTAEYGNDYTWLYKASDGVLLSARTDIVTPTNNGATESVVDGNLNILIPHSNTSKNIRYDLVDTVSTNGKLSAKFKINDLAKHSEAAYGFRLQLSNGTNGIMFYEYYDGTNFKLLTYSGTTLTDVIDLQFDTWYIIEIEINNGTYSIKLNNEVVYTSTTPATYYCTANRIQIQNSGLDVGTSNDTDIDIAWITYKDND